MEKLLTIALIGLVLATSSILVNTAHAVSAREVAVQYTQTGAEYQHGPWCMDARVF